MINLAVLVSGNGSNLQTLIEETKNGVLQCVADITIVVSSDNKAYALERAKNAGIDTMIINNNDDYMIRDLKRRGVDLVILAGYIRILSPAFIEAFKDRILNIHPSLLPAFGGKNMYGMNVHKAVIESKAKQTGCSVHLVIDEIDQGPILNQVVVGVDENDTPESLAHKVSDLEHTVYAPTIKKYIEEKLCLKNL